MIEIHASALQQAREFFEQQGARGWEGTAMLAGPPQRAVRCVIPEQVARRSPLGVSVTVTEAGKLQLASALHDDERWLARIHSHPDEAFHSSTDDDNLALTADGALSIVVPFFGLGLRRGLQACAVFIYRDWKWIALSDDPQRQTVREVQR